MNNDINKFYLCGLKKNDISVFKKMMLLKIYKGCFFMCIKIEVNYNLFLIMNNLFDVINK